MLRLLLVCLACFSCAPKKIRDPLIVHRSQYVDKLEALKKKLIAEVLPMQDKQTGWVSDDCDAMLWNAKLATVSGVSVDIKSAMYKDQPGRYGRRPGVPCYPHAQGHSTSKTTWSRDMGMGLILYAQRTGRPDLLDEHAKYGEQNKWLMGKPLADFRAIYTPNIQSLLYQSMSSLGGRKSLRRFYPIYFAAGLDDYQAHLQMMTIDVLGLVDGTLTKLMISRVKEHVEREPYNAYYAYLLARIDGEYLRAVRLVLNDNTRKGDYVRCDDMKSCLLAERLFVLESLLQDLVQ